MGKYDSEIKNSIFSFSVLEKTDIQDINNTIQYNYEIVKNYYTQSFSLNEVLLMLEDIKSSYYSGMIIEEIERKINEMRKSVPYSKKDVSGSIYKIGCAALTALVVLSEQSDITIKQQAFALYERKNASYNDVWYVRGIEGVCVDINRKISRLNSIIMNQGVISDDETLTETFIDTFVFAAFLNTALENF